MIKHYIIMSSSYTDGSRVALDITEDCFLNSKAIAEMIEEIRKNCGKDVPLNAVEPYPFLCYNYNKKNATEVFP